MFAFRATRPLAAHPSVCAWCKLVRPQQHPRQRLEVLALLHNTETKSDRDHRCCYGYFKTITSSPHIAVHDDVHLNAH